MVSVLLASYLVSLVRLGYAGLGSRKGREGKRQEERSMTQEEEVALLRSRYLEKLTNKLSPGDPSAEKVMEALTGADGLCESIANEESPSNREGMIKALKAAFLGAAYIESRMQPVAELFGSYIRERVALAKVGREQTSPANASQTPARTATPAIGTPASQENQSLSDLRERFLERIMAVQRPKLFQEEQEIRTCLANLDRSCGVILQSKSSRQLEASLRAAEAAFQSAVEFDPSFEPFIGLLTSYIQERVTLQIQSERAFLDDAPKIVIRSLIIPGDKIKEGTLVKGVSTLWFEIMQRIRDDPDNIYQIDCWKWEELLAGAYKQDGWDVVVLTPKKGDKGIDVIAERKGWGQLRFLLLDQMKAYKPDHLIGPDEIREMKGVLMDHPEASKALITTTADFTSGALEAAQNLAPRMELRPRDKLLAWLASVATGR
jgi:restriction system protein